MRKLAIGFDPGSTKTGAAVLAQDDNGLVVFVNAVYFHNSVAVALDLLRDISTPRAREGKIRPMVGVEAPFGSYFGGHMIKQAQFGGYLLWRAEELGLYVAGYTHHQWSSFCAPGYRKVKSKSAREKHVHATLQSLIVDFPAKSNVHLRDAIGVAYRRIHAD